MFVTERTEKLWKEQNNYRGSNVCDRQTDVRNVNTLKEIWVGGNVNNTQDITKTLPPHSLRSKITSKLVMDVEGEMQKNKIKSLNINNQNSHLKQAAKSQYV